ncbi:MAG: 60S ribosomal protein L36 [Amphiamblys sp. WSBS2006]|nr:MAG: 60S ribosomal protein L36 [Amphiamblys sp. WSBS2006]
MEACGLVVAEDKHQKTGLAVGPNRGHKTTKLKQAVKKQSKRIDKTLVKGVIKEIGGFAPYEKKLIDLVKNGKDKKARKFAKTRLGSFKRGKRKVEEISSIVSEMRRAGTKG